MFIVIHLACPDCKKKNKLYTLRFDDIHIRAVVFNMGSANAFKGAAKAKGSVRGPQYLCLLIINVF